MSNPKEERVLIEAELIDRFGAEDSLGNPTAVFVVVIDDIEGGQDKFQVLSIPKAAERLARFGMTAGSHRTPGGKVTLDRVIGVLWRIREKLGGTRNVRFGIVFGPSRMIPGKVPGIANIGVGMRCHHSLFCLNAWELPTAGDGVDPEKANWNAKINRGRSAGMPISPA